ncbi:MAG: sigma-54 dependent transcriptional regulator, partial [candidate division NC10 bacterium]|nr:sigma-54 dependent transcriptional regulator [candidate division NC10 bacterium]
MPEKILVADDERSIRESLKVFLEGEGFSTLMAEDGLEASAMLAREGADLVICDLKMPRMGGMELLKALKEKDREIPIIIMTGYGTMELAIEAIKGGAFDFITKPFKLDRLLIIIQNALEKGRLSQENRCLRRELEERYSFANIIGKSPKMQEVFRLIEQLAETDSTILIQGKSGTGKELVARAIHYHSPRKGRPFVSVNCGGLAESLLESELFGHLKGSFTGAITSRRGLLQEAQGGTLFLDEIGDMPSSMQVKLLRTLQDGEIRPVGGTHIIKVDVRFISATNKDLDKAVEEGRFREDLYYRLNVITLTIPDLSERKEDIPLLAAHFIQKYGSALKKEISGISPEAMALLVDYSWPGNVRELENCIERAAVLAKGKEILPIDLPGSLRRGQGDRTLQVRIPLTLEELEREAIDRTLRYTKG